VLASGAIWFAALSETVAVTWPTLSTVMDGNLADETNQGRWWFDAWFAESGYAPATYAEAVTGQTEPIWFSPLDTLDVL
jgi:hypothetical protein